MDKAQGDRYFIVVENGIPHCRYSIDELLTYLFELFDSQYYSGESIEVHLFEWHDLKIAPLTIRNTVGMQFDSNDYAYPEWTVFNGTEKIGSFSTRIDGRS